MPLVSRRPPARCSAARRTIARRPWRQGAAGVGIFVGVFAPSSGAQAQPSEAGAPSANAQAQPSEAGAPSSGAHEPSPVDFSSQIPQRVVATHPLNVKRQFREFGLQVSAIESRLTSRRDRGVDGLDVFVSVGLAPRLPVLRVSGYRGMILRAFDSKSFSFTPFFQGLEGGGHLGIFEVGTTAGLSAISVDVSHGDWSFGLLQPRVSAFAGLKIQQFRLRAVALSEFYWRWLGEDSAFVRGLGLQLVIGTPNTAF